MSTGDDCPPPLVLEYNVGATGTGQAYTINRTDGTLPAGDIRQGTEPELMLTRGAVYTFHIKYSTTPHNFYICKPKPDGGYEKYIGLDSPTSSDSLKFTVPYDATGEWKYSSKEDGTGSLGGTILLEGMCVPCPTPLFHPVTYGNNFTLHQKEQIQKALDKWSEVINFGNVIVNPLGELTSIELTISHVPANEQEVRGYWKMVDN